MTQQLLDCVVLQFAKSPSPLVKTRLATVLNETERLSLHCALVTWVCQQVSAIDCDRQLWVTDSINDPFVKQLDSAFQLSSYEQTGDDLGQRMQNAFASALNNYSRVLIIGSDCPFIDEHYLKEAYLKLENCDVVIGPALDGGYVLLGLKYNFSDLFINIPWGSAEVFEKTIAKVNDLKLTYKILPTLADIDRPEDLQLLQDQRLPSNLQAFANAND